MYALYMWKEAHCFSELPIGRPAAALEATDDAKSNIKMKNQNFLCLYRLSCLHIQKNMIPIILHCFMQLIWITIVTDAKIMDSGRFLE